MHDIGRLPVHDAGTGHDLRSGEQTEGLMAETDTEHRNFRIKQPQKRHAQPGVFGPPRPGRDADHAQGRVLRHVRQTRIVVFHHHGLLPESVKGLRQIAGKRIVIIDEQKHDLHSHD